MQKYQRPSVKYKETLLTESSDGFVPVVLFMKLPVGMWFEFLNKRVSEEIVGEHPTERGPYLKVTFELFVTYTDRRTAYAALLTEKVFQSQPGLY